MTRAQVIAAAAAAAGVAGGWEALAAVERARTAAWLAVVLRPLRRAGTGAEPSAGERRRLAALAAGGVLAAGWILAGPLLAVPAAVAAPAATGALLAQRRRAYRRRLALGAAPAARALAAAMGAGRSVRSAVAEAAHGLEGPPGHELARTAAALSAGEPTEVALENLRARARSRQWDTLVAAVLLQREAGGDLPGLLRELARAQETAQGAERDARAVTAQARFTATLVAGLPVLATALAELAGPGFLAGLVANPLSATLVVIAVALQLTALAAVRAVNRELE